MRFIGATKVGTDPFRQLASRKHPVGLDDIPFAVDPFGFNRVEPGTLGGQEERQDAHAFAGLLDLLIVLAYPGAYGLAFVPGGVIGRSRANASCLA